MTVHVLMPVFNRLAMTQFMLECLRAQVADEALALTVIDDGSTDGTGAFLAFQDDVTVLNGDGSLWWGGAIDLGLRHVLAKASADDWVLFVNNDTHIRAEYVQALLDVGRQCAPAAVGSVIRDEQPPHRLLSIGPRIDAWRMRITDALDNLPKAEEAASGVLPVDALSGRGVLYPVAALRAVGGMRPRWLPHYLADYELALRVRAAGWRLVVSLSPAVYSREDYGNAIRGVSLRERLFAARSPSYLPARARFWWSASSGLQRLSLPCRAAVRMLYSELRKKV